MAKSKWVVEEDRYVYRIQWFDAEDQDLGAIFGDAKYPGLHQGHFPINPKEPAQATAWDRGHNAGVDAVLISGLGTFGRMGIEFESNANAQKALRILNACCKMAHDKTPWPDWALQARAAGWKAPKGWKP